ncbi:MAG: CBS domain-containing protein, partial [Chthoniobacteraceae bacterium]
THLEREMIHTVVDFRSVMAKDVMLPMEDVQSLPPGTPVQELIERHGATNLDRWPVRGKGGAVTGLVNVLDVALDLCRHPQVGDYQRRIVKLAPNEPAFTVLRKLRAARSTMAVVLDPSGRPVGIVAWEDLIRLVKTAAA